jgi:hypothetical protein
MFFQWDASLFNLATDVVLDGILIVTNERSKLVFEAVKTRFQTTDQASQRRWFLIEVGASLSFEVLLGLVTEDCNNNPIYTDRDAHVNVLPFFFRFLFAVAENDPVTIFAGQVVRYIVQFFHYFQHLLTGFFFHIAGLADHPRNRHR